MELRSLLRIVGSLRFAAVILVMLCIAMACATVYEAMHGTPAALQVFYKATWFQALLGLLGLNLLASALARYPWSRKHVGFLITHGSLLAILGGALVTEQWGINGQAAILEGQTASTFTTDADALVLGGHGQEPVKTVKLTGVGGVKPLDEVSGPVLEHGSLRAVVEAYLPDSTWTERVLNDNPKPNPAVEIKIGSQGRATNAWILAGESGASAVAASYRLAGSSAEFDEFMAGVPKPDQQPQTVKLEINGETFEFPLETCKAEAVAVGETGYTVKVLRYLPHAMVGEGRQLTSASDQPVNPAIEAEISSPDGTSKRLAFARFPDFGSMHGTETPAAEVKLSFIAPVQEQAKTPVELVAAPDGRLAVRFNPEKASSTAVEVTEGKDLETPWPGMTFSVVQRFENARREKVLEPVTPVRENRRPAVRVRLSTGEDSRQIWLRKHEPHHLDADGDHYDLAYAQMSMPLGFELRLNKFVVGTYPGTQRPRSFESHVTLADSLGNEENRIISMNHPAKFGGYSLFQSSYEQSRGGGTTSVLSVSWDPGQPIVFTGYVTLILGMLYVLVTHMRRKGRSADSVNGGKSAPQPTAEALQTVPQAQPSGSGNQQVPAGVTRGLAIALAVVLAFQAGELRAEPGAVLPSKIDLSEIRKLPVQHDGRWMPLDTLARDVVNGITGEKFHLGEDPVRWLLAWTFDPQTWGREALIPIGSAELRNELKLTAQRNRFSYSELLAHQPLREQMDHLSHRSGGKMNPLESKVNDIQGKLVDLQQVFRNQVIKPIPDPEAPRGAWQPIAMPTGHQSQAATPVQSAWSQLSKAFLADDADGFNQAVADLNAALGELPAAFRPADKQIATELRYNQLQPYSLAWKLMVAGALFSALALVVKLRAFDGVAILVMLTGFAALTYGMGLRWQIAGRIPAANMFESLLFLSWGAGAFAIVAMIFLKDRSVPLTASAIGALSLFLADTLPLDHFIRPIAPVLLDTVWMSIHVPGIMVSYAVLALAALIAHVQMIAMAAFPERKRFIDRIDSMHYWYMHVGVILLGAGIITGSMWAAFSWGRYWGWDPKEVWSLIAFLAYLVIMHVRVDRERMPSWTYALSAVLGVALFVMVAPKLAPLSALKVMALAGAALAGILFIMLRGQFATAFKSAVAFWFIIMTYIGVNYVLGIGLHSYGFGTGAVVKYMMLTGTIDLLICCLLAGIYLARSSSNPGGLEPNQRLTAGA